MTRLVKRYWAEIIVFGVIFGALLVCLSPGMTWLNTDSDGAHYILAAKYMQTAHNTSAPLYLLLGRLFLFLPFKDAVCMGLISVFATTFASIMIYKSVSYHCRNNKNYKWYALISAFMYGTSALVISQSTMIETYPLAVALSLSAYYFSLKRKWITTSVVIGLLWAVHTLFAWMIWIILLVSHKELRDITLILTTLAFLAFYLYIPIVVAINGDNLMWGNTTFIGFIKGNLGVLTMLAGALSIWDIPKRILDIVAILGVSMGLGLPLVIYYLCKQKTWRNKLLWLFVLPIIWFAINLSSQTYVYMLPSIAFGSVIVGICLSKINVKFAYAIIIIAVLLAGFNVNYYDIGRTLDPEMSTERFYHEELTKIPDGDIFMGSGWTWAIVYLYNKENGTNIIPILLDNLPSEEYQDILISKGIQLERSDSKDHITRQGEVALSIVELNDGVWTEKIVKPEYYQYVIEPAKGNEDYIGRWIGDKVEPEWRFMPSNPYKFISGELEIAEWHHVLRSNHNANFVIMICLYVVVFMLVLDRLSRRKKNVR